MGTTALLSSLNGTVPTVFLGKIAGLVPKVGGNIGPRPFLAQLPDSFWLPAQASTVAGEVDTVFYVVYWISLIFFALIVGLMILFAIQYRRRKGHKVEPSPHHSVKLEVTWTVIPTLLVILIFWLGFRSFLTVATPPANAYEISVTGQKWQWFFTYPNGHTTGELHVPVDRPVSLTMTSEDVIHSLWIPAFRVKKDVVPGRYNKVWFQATEVGEYPLLCTEYCGTGHSDMLSRVLVHEPGGFETWLRESADILGTLPPVEAGQKLYQTKGCAQCHSVDGSAGIGPPFQDLFGGTYHLKSGEQGTVDENYVRESVLDPQAAIVAGFEPVMPTYAGKLKDQEITMLIAYFKSISRHAPAPAEGEDAAQAAGGTDDSAGGSGQPAETQDESPESTPDSGAPGDVEGE